MAHRRAGAAVLVPVTLRRCDVRVYSAIYDVTEPYLSLFRRFLPMPHVGNAALDLSAIVALIVLFVLIQIVARL